ncbi:MAG: PAS domain S-box protein [Actinomycetota bacterium]|nr:PAS domain S-box protein [Actinomycetota bacterium]
MSEKDRVPELSPPPEHVLFDVIAANVDGMIVLDTAGVILFANPAAEELFGVASGDLVGVEFGHPVLGDRPFEVELPRRGETRIAELRAAGIEWQGRPAFLASLRDVTERRRQERELQAAKAELEETNRRLQATIEERDRSYWQLKRIAEVLPICMDCGDVRPEGEWMDVVDYLKQNAMFLSHGLCPSCERRRVEALEES